MPTEKGQSPFEVWCIDTIVGLPPGEGGATYLLVCVCALSKWVEAWPTDNIKSHTVMTLFHTNVTCRYGVPAVVRTDRGREF